MKDADFQAILDAQQYTIPVTLTGAQLASVLCSAFDGGSTYWAAYVEVTVPPKDNVDVSAYLVPFLGGALKVHLRPSHDPPRQLDLAAILDGVRILWEKYPHHFIDLISNGNGDADTGDALLQCAIFGNLPFG